MERPKTVMEVSTPETSTSTLGLKRYLENAVEFSWIVTWSVEPLLKNSEEQSIDVPATEHRQTFP